MPSNLAPNLFPIVSVIAVLIVIVFIVLLILRALFKKGGNLPQAFDKVIFNIVLPKETGSEDSKREVNKEQIEEQIAQAEELFASIGGMRAQYGILYWFFGRTDHVSFELVVQNGEILFYVVVPKYLANYTEQQIHGQYPHAQIEKVAEYNIFQSTSKVAAAYLQFSKNYIFPIKTFRKLDSDPMDAVTNTLSKVAEQDGAVIQFVVRSAKKQWRRKASRVVHEMNQGKSLNKAMKSATTGNVAHKLYSFMGEMWSAGYASKTKSEKETEEQSKGISQPHKLSAYEEEASKMFEEKASKAGLDVNIRIITSASDKQTAKEYLDNITNSFSQYSIYEYGNKFSKAVPRSINRIIKDFIYRNFDGKRRLILNTEELASVFHFPLPSWQTPNIKWLKSRKAPAPVDMPKEGVILGKNLYRGKETIIRMKTADRRRHVYTIGMTGVGKSVLFENMIKQDMKAGRGVGIIDPHGSLAEEALGYVPKERADDVVYFNPADIERPVGLNMLEAKTPEEMDFVTQEMVQIFYKLVTDPAMIGPMFEHNMRNAMLTLMSDKENPGTITEIPRIFTDEEFQRYKLQFVTDPMVRAFWEKEMAKTSDYHKSEMLGYLISKVGRFVENEMIRNIIGQPSSGFDFKRIMNEGKILIANLSKGQVGEVNSNLLGLIIVSKLQMAALSRAGMPEEERKDFYLYIDEFQNYVTDSIATILAEARKYKLNLNMAHQYISQLVNRDDASIRDAVFGNAGTMIAFRVGVEDAEVIAKQFEPVFGEYDVMNIERFNAYVRLLIDKSASKAFNMETFPPPPINQDLADKIKELSRTKYGRPRQEVTQDILKHSKLA